MSNIVKRIISFLCLIASLNNTGIAAVQFPNEAAASDESAPIAGEKISSVPHFLSRPYRAELPGPDRRMLAEAFAREVARPPVTMPKTALPPARQAGAQTRGWIGRHNVLFGAIVGAGAGTVYGAKAQNELICTGGDEDCFFYGKRRILVGTGLGAGIGALVGVVVGWVRR